MLTTSSQCSINKLNNISLITKHHKKLLFRIGQFYFTDVLLHKVKVNLNLQGLVPNNFYISEKQKMKSAKKICMKIYREILLYCFRFEHFERNFRATMF